MDGIGIAGSNRAGPRMLARLHDAGIAACGFCLHRSNHCLHANGLDDFKLGLRVLFLIPHDIAEAEALLFETAALVKVAGSLETIVIASTLSPRYVRALRGRIPSSISLVDAPFSGTVHAAEKGDLSFFLGGRRDEIERLQPIFSVLGNQGVRMGGFGAAMAAKVMNDFLAATSTAMTRIALDWAEAQGIDESRLLEMTKSSLGSGHLIQGSDMVSFGTRDHADEEAVNDLMRNVETALDTALAGAHLTPPRAVEQLVRSIKSRALH
ncbi:MAG: NAD(P)-binding domain-containing protein [Paracoccaceae bacterium]|jgi:3-hydroxyisobutyrate dehydrogenase-like beta-hydroxyacid dehydrogenase|nr:NAD(P)-binding domain-containing protein [Paracoccaceae bacterium]